MLSDQLVSAFQLTHVLFNAALFFLMAYQGLLGWRIRRKRIAGVLQDFGDLQNDPRGAAVEDEDLDDSGPANAVP